MQMSIKEQWDNFNATIWWGDLQTHLMPRNKRSDEAREARRLLREMMGRSSSALFEMFESLGGTVTVEEGADWATFHYPMVSAEELRAALDAASKETYEEELERKMAEKEQKADGTAMVRVETHDGVTLLNERLNTARWEDEVAEQIGGGWELQPVLSIDSETVYGWFDDGMRHIRRDHSNGYIFRTPEDGPSELDKYARICETGEPCIPVNIIIEGDPRHQLPSYRAIDGRVYRNQDGQLYPTAVTYDVDNQTNAGADALIEAVRRDRGESALVEAVKDEWRDE